MKPRIAKIAQPRVEGVVERYRLFDLLDNGIKKKIIWISAPAGSGKTTLIANWLHVRKLPCLWYQADEGDRDIASFFSYLGQAAKNATPRLRATLPLFTTEYRLGLTTFTRRYFENLYARFKPPLCLVIDNYQEMPLDAPFHEVVRDGGITLPEGMTVVIISRIDPPAPFSRLLMNGCLELLTWENIRFTLEESRMLVEVREKKNMAEATVLALYERTEGWAAALVLMADNAARWGKVPGLENIPSEGIFSYFVDELFDRSPVETQAFLLTSSFLPRMTAASASELTGNDHANRLLSDLSRHNFLVQQHAAAELTYQVHPLFGEFLLHRAHEFYSSVDVLRIKKKAALLLFRMEQHEDAAQLMIEIADWTGLTGLILHSAKKLVAEGQVLTLGAWIHKVPLERVETNG